MRGCDEWDQWREQCESSAGAVREQCGSSIGAVLEQSGSVASERDSATPFCTAKLTPSSTSSKSPCEARVHEGWVPFLHRYNNRKKGRKKKKKTALHPETEKKNKKKLR